MNKQTFLDIEERALLNIDKCSLQQFCVTFIPSAFYKAPELEETGARLLNNNRLASIGYLWYICIIRVRCMNIELREW